MNAIDFGIVILYFLLVIGLGFWYQRRASRNLESYFLGGKRLPWWALAMSGSVSTFDITGTMWIVSVLYLLGMKSMWHHWMWGFLMGAFFLAYMGKWVRRSNVMTAAEWMKTRFGETPGGKLARTVYALMAVVTQASFIGYAFQGIGKFAAVYIPLEDLARYTTIPWVRQLVTVHEPAVLAVAIITVTTLYVVLGGLYSVVVTDVVQTIILTLGSLCIAWIAWRRLTPDLLARLPHDWSSLGFSWRLPQFAGTPDHQFEFFGPLVIVWIAKGLLLNAGGPAQMYDFQRFLAARHARDAAKIGAAWSLFLIVRWAMAVGIALLALTGAAGVTDSEKVMPLILRDFMPVGFRGIVIAGLLAAFMSTFSSTVNSGASFIVRDLWQPFWGKHASGPVYRSGLELDDDGPGRRRRHSQRPSLVLVALQRMGLCRRHPRRHAVVAGGPVFPRYPHLLCLPRHLWRLVAGRRPDDPPHLSRGFRHPRPFLSQCPPFRFLAAGPPGDPGNRILSFRSFG